MNDLWLAILSGGVALLFAYVLYDFLRTGKAALRAVDATRAGNPMAYWLLVTAEAAFVLVMLGLAVRHGLRID